MSHYVEKCKHGVVVAQCRCLGPGKVEVLVACPSTCAIIVDRTYHDDGTLSKVYESMRMAGLTKEQSSTVVSHLLNDGILFRERVPG